jgi:hypothetical protein
MKPLCRSCRWFVYITARVAGKLEEWPDCQKKMAGFPEMTMCHQYQREPGSDDE